jgi:tRNA pseudouridine13 synthase
MIELPFCLGAPAATATLRATPDDYQVDEVLGFEPDGTGDHVLLHVRKRDTNTEWLARQLAKFARVRPIDVGYSGLKDRNAVTTQWFSVNLAGAAEPDWTRLNSDNVQVLQVARNRRKLRRGVHAANRFVIALRNVQGDRADLEQRLRTIAAHGVPNYFGEQRFGHDAGNVGRAREMFASQRPVRDRHARGMLLSAARSHVFNLVLAQRVADRTWNRPLPGDAFTLDGTHSFFVADTIDETLHRRLAEFDIHPSGPLWGRGEPPSRGAARELERAVVAGNPELAEGLERAGLSQERRAARLPVRSLEWADAGTTALQLRFQLEPGAYATTVLRELIRSHV